MGKSRLSKFTPFVVMMFYVVSGYGFKPDVGLAVKGSTMGYGGDVIVRLHEKMTARVGYDQFYLNAYTFSFVDSDIEYNASAVLSTGSVTVLCDYNIGGLLFVSAGIAYNNFNINISGEAGSELVWGDITIPRDKIGDFEFTINPGLKFSPYLGIGLGKTLSHKLIGFAFEVGSYYMGSPDITITTTGVISPTSDSAFGKEELYEEQVSQYNLYPVVKFSLSF